MLRTMLITDLFKLRTILIPIHYSSYCFKYHLNCQFNYYHTCIITYNYYEVLSCYDLLLIIGY